MATDLPSIGFGHEFPYANIHELNLDWMLRKLKELENRVTDLERRMDEAERRIEDHERRIQWLEAEIIKLREEWEAFKAYIEDRFDQLEQEIRTLFAQLEARIDARFAELERAFNERFTRLENELKTQVQQILQYIIDKCAEFQDALTRLTVRVENIETNMEECCMTISGKLDDVLDALNAINPDLIRKVIDQNGTYRAADDGANGFYEVVVNVPTGGGDPTLESITITENGTFIPPTGVDGYNSITVQVPSIAPVLRELQVTQNGTYTPPNGVDGYSKVEVDIPIPLPEMAVTNASMMYASPLEFEVDYTVPNTYDLRTDNLSVKVSVPENRRNDEGLRTDPANTLLTGIPMNVVPVAVTNGKLCTYENLTGYTISVLDIPSGAVEGVFMGLRFQYVEENEATKEYANSGNNTTSGNYSHYLRHYFPSTQPENVTLEPMTATGARVHTPAAGKCGAVCGFHFSVTKRPSADSAKIDELNAALRGKRFHFKVTVNMIRPFWAYVGDNA